MPGRSTSEGASLWIRMKSMPLRLSVCSQSLTILTERLRLRRRGSLLLSSKKNIAKRCMSARRLGRRRYRIFTRSLRVGFVTHS